VSAFWAMHENWFRRSRTNRAPQFDGAPEIRPTEVAFSLAVEEGRTRRVKLLLSQWFSLSGVLRTLARGLQNRASAGDGRRAWHPPESAPRNGQNDETAVPPPRSRKTAQKLHRRFLEFTQVWWAQRDLNPRPSDYESSDQARSFRA
jgi:hypothetical protein